MIAPDVLAERWLCAWDRHDIDALLELYNGDIQLRSPFAKVYAQSGIVRGKTELRAYYREIERRIPNLVLRKVALYIGYQTLALHYCDDRGRNCVESVMLNDEGRALMQFASFDRLR
jgi:hypothetical protein